MEINIFNGLCQNNKVNVTIPMMDAAEISPMPEGIISETKWYLTAQENHPKVNKPKANTTNCKIASIPSMSVLFFARLYYADKTGSALFGNLDVKKSS